MGKSVTQFSQSDIDPRSIEAPTFGHSDIDPSSIEAPDEPHGILGALGKIGRAVDSYSGAPARAAIRAAQKGENPISAGWNQVGQDPSTAPSGKEIVRAAGLSDEPLGEFKGSTALDVASRALGPAGGLAKAAVQGLVPKSLLDRTYSPSAADIGGAAMEFAADPINLLPLAGEATGLKDAAGAGFKAAGEKAAVNATGATGLQASKFADNAGRELLDQGVVKFGDNQAKIAKRAQGAVDVANKKIDTALTPLQASGVTVDRNDIYNTVRQTINKMKGDESKADIVKALENELDNVIGASEASGPKVGIADAEGIKRGFKRKAGNWADPEKGMAGKEMYQTYRDAVEDAATKADPALAQQFEEGKKAYGLFDPIREAAERRALTTSQSPWGGFMDVASAAGGHAAAGNPGAVLVPIGRRFISPRLSSSAAVTLDKFGNVVRGAPLAPGLLLRNGLVPTGMLQAPRSGLAGGEQ